MWKKIPKMLQAKGGAWGVRRGINLWYLIHRELLVIVWSSEVGVKGCREKETGLFNPSKLTFIAIRNYILCEFRRLEVLIDI